MVSDEGGGEMVIYADVLFALNSLVDYLLLLAAARAAGGPLKRLRFFLGAALGGGYAVAIFLPGFSFLGKGMYPVLFCVLMLMVAYGTSGLLFKQAIVFLAMTFGLGGGILAIGMMDGGALSLGRGVVYSVPDVKLLMLSAAGCYALLQLAAPVLFRHTRAEGTIHDVTFELLDRRLTLAAFSDSGNTLTDPVRGAVVPVAEGRALRPVFPSGCCPNEEELRDPVSALSRLNRGEMAGRFRLLPYRTVGVERGLLLAVKMDRVTIKGKGERGVLVALSPTPVSDGGGYHVLTGGD